MEEAGRRQKGGSSEADYLERGGLRGRAVGESGGLGKFCRLFLAEIKHLLLHPVPL